MSGLPWNCAPVLSVLKPEKPRPCAISCSTTLRKLIWPLGVLPSRPKYQEEPSRHPVLPILPLNCIWISAAPPPASSPASASVSAEWYHTPGSAPDGAGLLNAYTLVVPAEPSTPVVAVQSRSLKVALLMIGTSLLSTAPHRSAANWNTISACRPRVVPGLPPTGVTGVGSSRPFWVPTS